MAVRHTNALRATHEGRELMMTVFYDDDDAIHCQTPFGDVAVVFNGAGQFDKLIMQLRALGLEPYGCFSCRFFHRPGDFDSDDDSLGYCLHGKEGQHVRMWDDTTTKGAGCDAYVYGTISDRQKTATAWVNSLRNA